MRARLLLVSSCVAGCVATAAAVLAADDLSVSRIFAFTPLRTSAACIPGGAGAFPNERPFRLPPGFTQTVVARQGDGGATDNWDMQTVNEPVRRRADSSIARTRQQRTGRSP